MRISNLKRAALWLFLGCFVPGLVAAAWAGDRKTSTKTFESSAVHTAGTEYSSGFLVENYAEGVVLVNVSSLTGTPALALVAETSEDNTTYFFHSALASGIGATGTTAYPLTNFGKYLRVRQTISGATTMTYDIKGVFKN
ncbi:MAG: hypothetical protein JXL84_15145 [Deltaproteobacteria bacterium]|nr:hypothetical protein [Deltaproteobacteria bacterium]